MELPKSARLLVCGVLSSLLISCAGEPARFSAQCNIELNLDSLPDTVIYARHGDTYKLVASIRKDQGFTSYLLTSSTYKMGFTCVTGERVITAIAKSGDKTVNQVDTGGAYILMRQSERSAIVYYMRDGKFREARIAG